jgi:hypothetical protein
VYKTLEDKTVKKVAFYIPNNVTFDEINAQGFISQEEILAYIKAKGDEKASQPDVLARINMPDIAPAPIVL